MSQTDDTNVPQSQLCRELRTKRYFFLDSLPLAPEDIRDVTGHCWCRRTMQVIGPDGNQVRPEGCGPGRGCYISHFA